MANPEISDYKQLITEESQSCSIWKSREMFYVSVCMQLPLPDITVIGIIIGNQQFHVNSRKKKCPTLLICTRS